MFCVVRYQWDSVSDRTNGDPSVVWGNRISGTLSFRYQLIKTTSNLFIVRDNYNITQGHIKFDPLFLAPIGFLRTEVEFTEGDKYDRNETALDEWTIGFFQFIFLHESRHNVCI